MTLVVAVVAEAAGLVVVAAGPDKAVEAEAAEGATSPDVVAAGLDVAVVAVAVAAGERLQTPRLSTAIVVNMHTWDVLRNRGIRRGFVGNIM